MGEHSWFSPSSASRLLSCPASIRALQEKKEKESNEHADRGTECHQAMEMYDLVGEVPNDFKEPWQYMAVKGAIDQRKMLLEEVFDTCQYAWQTETTISLKELGFKDVFGTVDFMAHCETKGLVLDYKFGAGVVVTPGNNAQLMTYAVGMSLMYPEIEEFYLAIIQPRVFDKPSYKTLSKDELDAWRNSVLVPGIKQAKALLENPDLEAEFNPTSENCRWCPWGDGTCPGQRTKLEDMLPKIKEAAAKPVEELSVQEMANILQEAEAIKTMLSALKAKAISLAEAGQRIPGFVLVKKKGNTTWTDTKKADNYLQRKGLKMRDRYTMKLLSPTAARTKLKQLEKLDQAALKWIEKNSFRPDRGFDLVPEKNPRSVNHEEVNPLDLL